ncbi:MAG: hypothetical protein ACK57N_03820, partial [Planctomycetia bacterium]
MKELTIGVDFGTHSTKVVYRDDSYSIKGTVLVDWPAPDAANHGHALDGPYPWFGIPSVIGADNGDLVFSEHARSLPIEQRLYGIKMLLLDSARTLGPLEPLMPKCNWNEARMLVVAAHLTWVLDQIRRALDRTFGIGGWYPLMVAIPAPMDQHEDPRLRELYERVTHAAMLGARKLAEYPPVQRLHAASAFAELLKYLRLPVPPETERNFEVLPETLAGMMPLQLDPERAPGLYNLVDVGGGTVELSLIFKRDQFRLLLDCDIDKSIRRTYKPDECSYIAGHLAQMWSYAYHRALQLGAVPAREWARTNHVLLFGGGASKQLEQALSKHHPVKTTTGSGAVKLGYYSAGPHTLDWTSACKHAAKQSVRTKEEDRR